MSCFIQQSSKKTSVHVPKSPEKRPVFDQHRLMGSLKATVLSEHFKEHMYIYNSCIQSYTIYIYYYVNTICIYIYIYIYWLLYYRQYRQYIHTYIYIYISLYYRQYIYIYIYIFIIIHIVWHTSHKELPQPLYISQHIVGTWVIRPGTYDQGHMSWWWASQWFISIEKHHCFGSRRLYKPQVVCSFLHPTKS